MGFLVETDRKEKKMPHECNYPKHGLAGKRYQQAYATMFAEQNGLCKICKRDQEHAPHKRFCIDHCHVTGKIRGLLCEPCNHLLGDIENFGCDELHNKIPLEEVQAAHPGAEWMNQDLYDRIHESSERWIQKHKDAVIRYLSE